MKDSSLAAHSSFCMVTSQRVLSLCLEPKVGQKQHMVEYICAYNAHVYDLNAVDTVVQGSVREECCKDVSEKSDGKQGCREVLEKSVVAKCRRKVLETVLREALEKRSVVEKCRRKVLENSVVEKC